MTKYLYIDDDNLEDSRDKVSGFAEAGRLEIAVENNRQKWEEEIDHLQKVDYDGLILDLKLDELPVDNGCHACYRGSELAQHIRDKQKEGVVKAIPIILFSGEDKIKSSLDSTAKDLFDLCLEKGSMVTVEQILPVVGQLEAIALCYRRLRSGEDAVRMLDSPMEIDNRFTGLLSDLQQNDSISSVARFILNEFILKPGLLIDERLLAARLGVDMEKSKEAWKAVTNLFKEVEYQGVLCHGWRRWWMRGVNMLWREFSGGEYLQMMEAEERVEILKDKLSIDSIVVAEKPKYSESNKFWTVCCGTGKPMDSIDGFMIAGQEALYPWQDLQYVSKEAAFLKTNLRRWRNVAPSEKVRLESMKHVYSGGLQ